MPHPFDVSVLIVLRVRAMILPHNRYGTDPYNGKMLGCDGIVGWFDSTGTGHVKAWGMPSYKPADILAHPKGRDYISNAALTRADGYTTVEFERRFTMLADADVSVDPSVRGRIFAAGGSSWFPQARHNAGSMQYCRPLSAAVSYPNLLFGADVGVVDDVGVRRGGLVSGRRG